ncbi:MAG: hypothetical protein EOP47_02260 [Sphingobacteriaceae bacterium]|nr:MAG: hypothetical protein EOP47_02260 [Sphingobacteriaceae bacterium]
MELDDLKTKWQKESTQNLEHNKHTMEQLQLVLKEKTTATLSGMKFKYKRILIMLSIGLLANAILQPFLHFIMGDGPPVFRITNSGMLSLISFIGLGLIVLIFYWIKYRSMPVNTINTDLKLTLSQNIESLKKSLRQEVIFIIALFVMLFIIGRMTSQYLGNGAFGDVFHTDIMLAIGAGVLMFAFYVYKRVSFYNRNIDELQQYLNEYKANIN